MSLPYAESPSIDALSVAGRDLRRSIREHSHIQLRDSEYRRAVELLLGRGAVEDRFYRAL